MKQQELKSAVQQVCKQSSLLQRILFSVLNAVTVRTWHVKRELKKWMRTAPERAHVLDAGSGVGQFSYWLSQVRPSFSVLAIDNCMEHVCGGNKFVRETKQTNLHFKSACVSQIDQENAFDMILCTQVLEYISDDQQTLENFHNALRESGRIIITTKTQYKEDICHEDKAQGIARCGYQMAALKEKVKAAGFRKVKAHYSGGKFGRLAEKIGFSLPIRMLKLSSAFAVILPFYYILALPISMVLNWMDSHSAHKDGEGIVLLALK